MRMNLATGTRLKEVKCGAAVATLIALAPSPSVAQTNPCPPEPTGRPSKATVRQLEERIECLKNLRRQAVTQSGQGAVEEQLLAGMRRSLSNRPPADEEALWKAFEDGFTNLPGQVDSSSEDWDLVLNAMIARDQQQTASHELFDEFANGNWSAAFAAVHGRSRITAAELDSAGIVRITEKKDEDFQPVVVLTPSLLTGKTDAGEYRDRLGIGPMFVASPGIVGSIDEDVPWIMGAGVMLAARTDDRGSSMGIGFGYALERAKALREDFAANMPAPLDGTGGYLEPVFENRTTGSWIFVLAFSLGNANTR